MPHVSQKVTVERKIQTCHSCNLVQKESATGISWILRLVCQDKETKEDLQLSVFNEATKQLLF